MVADVNRLPDARPPHPGRMLRQLLDEKAWTIEDLAAITGYSRTAISAVSAERGGVSADMAVALGAAFGNGAADWLRWDAEYQLSLVETDPASVERRAKLHDIAPIRDMRKRGWIRETKNDRELEDELARFYGSPLLDATPFSLATFRAESLRDLNPAEKAWCFQARRLANTIPVAVFDRGRLDAAERKLRQLAAFSQEAKRLPQALAHFGIRLVIVEPLPGSRIDGAAFWIGESPAIAVSARWDRVDAFWFTLVHEFMHIKNDDAYSVDINLYHEGEAGVAIAADNDAEQRANDQAADLLVPKTELESFIRRVSPLYATVRIVQFAHRIRMHPGIIVGQLQHRGELRYSAHRDLLVKIRALVTETALTDGWGNSVSPDVV